MADIEIDELPRPELNFKILIVGNADVGKSAFIRRFVLDSFSPLKSTKPTGLKYHEDVLVQLREPFAMEDMLAKLLIWDTENPHELEPILKSKHTVNCTGVLYCYDVNNRQSFEDIPHWMSAVERISSSTTKALVGLHCDRKVEKRQVLTSEGRDFATSRGMRFTRTTSLPFPHFFEASNKKGTNVESSLMGLVYRMMKMSLEVAPNSDKYSLAVIRGMGGGSVAAVPTSAQVQAYADWLRAQTKRPATPSPPPPVPVVEHWPESPVAAFCRDVGGMSLAEFDWCLNKNHWDADLGHLPLGHPHPPLQEPVWWWAGWGSIWGKVPGGTDPYRYVENWFVRGKARSREPFTPYFGTKESEAAAEFSAALGGASLQQSLLEAEAESGARALNNGGLESDPVFVPPTAAELAGIADGGAGGARKASKPVLRHAGSATARK